MANPVPIQTVPNGNSTSSSVSAVMAGVAVGNVVVVIAVSSGTFSSFADDGGNTWTLIGTPATPATGSYRAYSSTIVNGGNITVTLTLTGNANNVILAREYSKLGARDKSTSASAASGTSVSSGSTSAISDNRELVIGVIGTDNASTTYTPGSGFGNTVTANGLTAGLGLFIEDQIVTAGGTQLANCTTDLGGPAWYAAVVTYKIVSDPSFKPNIMRPAIFRPGLAR